MSEETQISAIVSQTTKALLERQARATGMKKGYLIEQALLHHLQALQELPADFVIHPKLVLSKNSGQAVLKQVRAAKPTKALRELMRDGD